MPNLTVLADDDTLTVAWLNKIDLVRRARTGAAGFTPALHDVLS